MATMGERRDERYDWDRTALRLIQSVFGKMLISQRAVWLSLLISIAVVVLSLNAVGNWIGKDAIQAMGVFFRGVPTDPKFVAQSPEKYEALVISSKFLRREFILITGSYLLCATLFADILANIQTRAFLAWRNRRRMPVLRFGVRQVGQVRVPIPSISLRHGSIPWIPFLSISIATTALIWLASSLMATAIAMYLAFGEIDSLFIHWWELVKSPVNTIFLGKHAVLSVEGGALPNYFDEISFASDLIIFSSMISTLFVHCWVIVVWMITKLGESVPIVNRAMLGFADKLRVFDLKRHPLMFVSLYFCVLSAVFQLAPAIVRFVANSSLLKSLR